MAILSVPPLEPSRLSMLANCSELRISSSWEPLSRAWVGRSPAQTLRRLDCSAGEWVARRPGLDCARLESRCTGR